MPGIRVMPGRSIGFALIGIGRSGPTETILSPVTSTYQPAWTLPSMPSNTPTGFSSSETGSDAGTAVGNLSQVYFYPDEVTMHIEQRFTPAADPSTARTRLGVRFGKVQKGVR